MSVIDINGILKDVSPDSPCGDNLEYDPAFGELERAARGKEEQTLGDATVAAEPPDWRDVRDRSTALLGRTLDLRVAVYLTRALLNTDGLAGLGDGLSLLRGLLERYWDCVYPQLDPDDNNDPTFRVNTLVTLCDRDVMLLNVQEAPLVSSRALGRFGLRQLKIALLLYPGSVPAVDHQEGRQPGHVKGGGGSPEDAEDQKQGYENHEDEEVDPAVCQLGPKHSPHDVPL